MYITFQSANMQLPTPCSSKHVPDLNYRVLHPVARNINCKCRNISWVQKLLNKILCQLLRNMSQMFFNWIQTLFYFSISLNYHQRIIYSYCGKHMLLTYFAYRYPSSSAGVCFREGESCTSVHPATSICYSQTTCAWSHHVYLHS
jgi:hypothetical protein